MKRYPLQKPTKTSAGEALIRELALFRYSLRKFLRFSEKAARLCGVTPQQHQLMLGVAGYTNTGRATLTQLAEFLQERHNSVVGLVERAAQRGLVRKLQDPNDHRFVFVSLTRKGENILLKLSALHKAEIRRLQDGLLTIAKTQCRKRKPTDE